MLLTRVCPQALYGRKSRNTDRDSDSAGTTNRHTTESPTEEDAELCTSASVDTMFNSADGSTYAFKGRCSCYRAARRGAQECAR